MARGKTNYQYRTVQKGGPVLGYWTQKQRRAGVRISKGTQKGFLATSKWKKVRRRKRF